MINAVSENTDDAIIANETGKAKKKEYHQENEDIDEEDKSKPMITDWLMVIITTIYVIATIIITVENMKATKTTRDQREASSRQFDERKRLDAMPYIYAAYKKTPTLYHSDSETFLIPSQINIIQSQYSSISFPITNYMLIIANLGNVTRLFTVLTDCKNTAN